jgi:hypothetical protein
MDVDGPLVVYTGNSDERQQLKKKPLRLHRWKETKTLESVQAISRELEE